MSNFCTECGNKLNENGICTNCNNTSTNASKIFCPKCNGSNVNIQVVNESHLVKDRRGCLWWLIIGWWWVALKWIVLTVPALIFKIFGVGKRKKIKNTTYKVAVCQNCGNSWKIK